MLRYICQIQLYSPKALYRWLKKIEAAPWKTEDEYLEAQADFGAKTYRALNPRVEARKIAELRQNLLKTLKNEHNLFKEYAEKGQQKIDAASKRREKEFLEELREYAKRAGNDFGGAKYNNFDEIPHESKKIKISSQDLLS